MSVFCDPTFYNIMDTLFDKEDSLSDNTDMNSYKDNTFVNSVDSFTYKREFPRRVNSDEDGSDLSGSIDLDQNNQDFESVTIKTESKDTIDAVSYTHLDVYKRQVL